MKALIIHGHFYQPPRENPWTGVVDPEPSAHPFHDWNERIHAECYLPNSAVRTVQREAQVKNSSSTITRSSVLTLDRRCFRGWSVSIRKLMHASWPPTLRASLSIDGHGNAIAQAYNHAILPLCNERDRRTQVRWGVADFRHRFGREPESMWLPETACNDEVLDLLIDEGLQFVILAPQQAERIRS